MKKYKEYMDSVRASDTLHQRLVGLEVSGKRSVPWARYGTVAATLALVVGVGAWGLGHGGWEAIQANFKSLATYCVEPEIADALQPDIAPEDPNAAVEPGEKTIGGYETTQGGMTTYHILPYIDYGGLKPTVASSPQVAADWDIPAGADRRELTQDEIMTLMGGEDAVNTHLDWGEYQLTGWAAWYEDGSFWGAYISGEKISAGLPLSASYPCPDDRFEFAVTANQLPPTCIVYSASVTQEVRGLTITAEGHDSVASESGGVDASTRRVSFMKDNYGCRFDITGTSRALTEERVSRLVARVAGEGLDLSAITSDGAKPLDTSSDYSVGEPNYEDGVGDYDPDCPYCADGTPHTHPYDPNEAADPSYNAPGTYTCEVCGQTLPAGTEHSHAQEETYTCSNCGETLPVGIAHDCELCGLPLAPAALTCGVCGQTYYEGAEHHCQSTCPTCGVTYGTGTPHTCRQGSHHQEQHHEGHH